MFTFKIRTWFENAKGWKAYSTDFDILTNIWMDIDQMLFPFGSRYRRDWAASGTCRVQMRNFHGRTIAPRIHQAEKKTLHFHEGQRRLVDYAK